MVVVERRDSGGGFKVRWYGARSRGDEMVFFFFLFSIFNFNFCLIKKISLPVL